MSAACASSSGSPRPSAPGSPGRSTSTAQLRITPPSAYDPNWANVAIFIVMVGGLGSLEGVLIGALIYSSPTDGSVTTSATYLVVLGLLTTVHGAAFARGGISGPDLQGGRRPVVPDARRTLLEDRP